MRRLLISFVFTLLTAQTAYADHSKAGYAVNLITAFEAGSVDSVINGDVTKIVCGEAVDVQEEVTEKSHRGPGRTPALEGNGKSKFDMFKERVAKGEFRKLFHEGGDLYSYSSVRQRTQFGDKPIFDIPVQESSHAFTRMSAGNGTPAFHELGLTEDKVKKNLVSLMEQADESYQTSKDAFSFRVGEKAYHIDLNLPLIANPVYKQDVTTGEIDYGLTGVTPKTKYPNFNFVSQN